MDHQEFCERWAAREFEVRVNRNYATEMATQGLISPFYTFVERFSSIGFIIGILAGAVLIFVVNWYTGLIILGLSIWIGMRTQDVAVIGILNKIRSDADFYNSIKDSDLLRVEKEGEFFLIGDL